MIENVPIENTVAGDYAEARFPVKNATIEKWPTWNCRIVEVEGSFIKVKRAGKSKATWVGRSCLLRVWRSSIRDSKLG